MPGFPIIAAFGSSSLSAAYHTFFHLASISAATATLHPKTNPALLEFLWAVAWEGVPLEFGMVTTSLCIQNQKPDPAFILKQKF